MVEHNERNLEQRKTQVATQSDAISREKIFVIPI